MEARKTWGSWLAALCAAASLLTAGGTWAESPDYGNSIGTATAVNANSSTAGTIGYAGDLDYFRISVPSSGTLTVYTTGSTDTYGYLKNSSGTDLAFNDDSSDANFRISRAVTAGTYYVAVRHYSSSGTGSYTLVNQFSGSTVTDDHGNSISTATAVSINTSRAGVINSAGDYDYFRISVPSSGTLTVYTTGSTDTYGYLKNSSGTDLAFNDDSSDANFRISRAVTAGTYYVAVRHYSSSGTGSYTLVNQFSGSTVTDDHGNSISTATAVSINTSRAGVINSAGDYDYFRISVPSSGTLTVYTTGSTDTYGYLKNSSGTDLAFNDDSSDANFRIARSVTAGTYYVAVRHYSSTGVGNYTLFIGFINPIAPSECSVTRGSLASAVANQRYNISSRCYTDYGWFPPVPLVSNLLTTSTNYDYRSRFYSANNNVTWTHGAVDLVSSSNNFSSTTPVHAIGNGVVKSITRSTSATNNLSVLYVEHTSSNGNKFIAIYGHTYALDSLYNAWMSTGSVSVAKGQQLGTMRLAGTPIHLHFELNANLSTRSFGGVKTGTVDPMQHLINNGGL